MAYEDWMSVSSRVVEVTGAALWMLGDLLAYGHANFQDTHWGKRTPSELYERLARETGYAEGTLANARVVCSRFPLSRRRDNVSFGHAVEIVGRVKDPEQYEDWVDWVSESGASVRQLRERLRTNGAAVRREVGDTGVVSFLEIARQFARDYASAKDGFSAPMRIEVAKILGPVVRDLVD